ncbi:CsgG/HfaB family protein [Pseudoduganella umbonata]|uniref:Curli biogenesis system outer membrane secretion channel CsgG n=1 Tax=Pseudoduganella umbonata TaxID=864828 RepID=A0A4P8HRI2_9BURK|nr:CsgG/HfaB family protein [Pseudoduganella umbonata]MBB3224414.1 curli biogenesis system outer membrane secretion channel CsgG [Pseudoduganella umbonata]QCP11228.1 curli production assembly protein CsgG [Pseudoduganella umbonata]
MSKHLGVAGVALLLSACATTSTPPVAVDAPVSRIQQIEAQKAAALPQQKIFKRKIAIGRFSNETRYGRSLLTDANADPLGKQASDMLASRLVGSNRFLVFERQDLGRIADEQKRTGASAADLIGVDALVLGSVTEFGRSTTGKAGFLSSTKVQTARAKVEIRLADARTGHIFFTASGTGEANTESGEIAGYGSRADYDATLNDRAIGAAISDVLTSLMNKLEERRWRTDILKSDGRQVFMSGGSRQGIRSGDTFAVMREGEKVKSGQTGFEIALPATAVGTVRVVSLFGDAESNEGAVAELVSGTLPTSGTNGYFITEAGK